MAITSAEATRACSNAESSASVTFSGLVLNSVTPGRAPNTDVLRKNAILRANDFMFENPANTSLFHTYPNMGPELYRSRPAVCSGPLPASEHTGLLNRGLHASPYLSARQYARCVESWVSSIGLDPSDYGTQSLRRTKPALIYRQTNSLLAAQLLLGHSRLRSTARLILSVDSAGNYPFRLARMAANEAVSTVG